MKRSVALLLISLFATIAIAAEPASPKVTADQAKALVLASLNVKQRRLPSLGAEQYDSPQSSPFLFFTVTWAGTPNGSVVVGNYAVDARTADVWSATIGCYEMKNNDLRALQAQMRATLHLSQAEYKKLKTKGPLCEE